MQPARLRMFAGPNGSGKSTLKEILDEHLLGIYINPDEIQKELSLTGFIDFTRFGIELSAESLFAHYQSSSLMQKVGQQHQVQDFDVRQNALYVNPLQVNAYICSVLADFMRIQLLNLPRSFSFETVMSFSDKIELLEKARQKGMKTYLYYVATEDPRINIQRVQYRVQTGGHPVPENKIVSRYAKSLGLLFDAIKASDRAYLFDNSNANESMAWIAEVTNGKHLEIKRDKIPHWFKTAVLDKISRPF